MTLNGVMAALGGRAYNYWLLADLWRDWPCRFPKITGSQIRFNYNKSTQNGRPPIWIFLGRLRGGRGRGQEKINK